MPAQILHVLFAEDALARASRSSTFAARAADAVLGDPAVSAAFRLGAQGPDLFYHSQRLRPVAIEYGTLLHRRGYGALSAALLGLALEDVPAPEAADSPRFAYALAFITHAILDRAVHPYIVSKAGWVSPARPETARYARCHAFFERLVDCLMLERLRGASASAWDQASLLAEPCAAPPADLAGFLAAGLARAFPSRAGVDGKLLLRVSNALRDASFFYRITDPSRTSLNLRLRDGYEYLSEDLGRASVALVYPELFPLDVDYLNLARAPWPRPSADGGTDDRSFVDLYGDALESAAATLAALLAAIGRTGTVPEGTEALVGDGGLSVQDADGRPCAPVHMDPLPLDRILDDQWRLRAERMRAAEAAPFD